jgi:hypothetical protein
MPAAQGQALCVQFCSTDTQLSGSALLPRYSSACLVARVATDTVTGLQRPTSNVQVQRVQLCVIN